MVKESKKLIYKFCLYRYFRNDEYPVYPERLELPNGFAYWSNTEENAKEALRKALGGKKKDGWWTVPDDYDKWTAHGEQMKGEKVRWVSMSVRHERGSWEFINEEK